MIFDVTPEEVNLIGAALGKMPYDAVSGLVVKLSKQLAEQQAASQQPDKPAVGSGTAATEQKVSE